MVREGSSPLARGPPTPARSPAHRIGLIPARAGTTVYHTIRNGVLGAHPRSRGDHANSSTTKKLSRGSSPLARGPRTLRRSRRRRCGLIPARAGTTWAKNIPAQPTWAHPRSRGDHDGSVPVAPFSSGSSPLARGPRRSWTTQIPSFGLIPARAGTTAKLVAPKRSLWAHPRSRGDHNPPPAC